MLAVVTWPAIAALLIGNGVAAVRRREFADGKSSAVVGPAAARCGWVPVSAGVAWFVIFGYLLFRYWFAQTPDAAAGLLTWLARQALDDLADKYDGVFDPDGLRAQGADPRDIKKAENAQRVLLGTHAYKMKYQRS